MRNRYTPKVEIDPNKKYIIEGTKLQMIVEQPSRFQLQKVQMLNTLEEYKEPKALEPGHLLGAKVEVVKKES